MEHLSFSLSLDKEGNKQLTLIACCGVISTEALQQLDQNGNQSLLDFLKVLFFFWFTIVRKTFPLILFFCIDNSWTNSQAMNNYLQTGNRRHTFCEKRFWKSANDTVEINRVSHTNYQYYYLSLPNFNQFLIFFTSYVGGMACWIKIIFQLIFLCPIDLWLWNNDVHGIVFLFGLLSFYWQFYWRMCKLECVKGSVILEIWDYLGGHLWCSVWFDLTIFLKLKVWVLNINGFNVQTLRNKKILEADDHFLHYHQKRERVLKLTNVVVRW